MHVYKHYTVYRNILVCMYVACINNYFNINFFFFFAESMETSKRLLNVKPT